DRPTRGNGAPHLPAFGKLGSQPPTLRTHFPTALECKRRIRPFVRSPEASLTSQFLERWQNVSVISIIDILIVALVIYYFLVLVKGTRAAQMLVGIGVLAFAFYVARLGELTTVNWLVTTLLPYAVFALI